ncbi:MAG: hypothetical protein RR413_05740 [Christensenellaceae bacterium]
MNVKNNFVVRNTNFFRDNYTKNANTLPPSSPFTIHMDTPSPKQSLLANYSLNEEQVKDLRNRYDIENLTSEDMDKLLAELAEMGTIAREDTNIMNSRPIVVGAFSQHETKNFNKGNALDWLSDSFLEFENQLKWMTDPDTFNYLDPSFSLQKKYNEASTTNHMNRLQKMLTVLNQIKRST